MKLAEKLAAMSDDQATKEEAVINEIVNFFAEKFENGDSDVVRIYASNDLLIIAI